MKTKTHKLIKALRRMRLYNEVVDRSAHAAKLCRNYKEDRRGYRRLLRQLFA